MESSDAGSYFNSYEDLEVHKLMLNDSVRNKAYKTAIFDNKDRIEGKTVLDVGGGTGVLSIFCAQAGAAKVYCVEASNIHKVAIDIVIENGFQNIIKVFHGKIEEVELPEKVDILVSEWMGFYLLHEGMLDSVITARTKFLKPNGLMFPEYATLYTAPCSVPSIYEYWDDVDGVSMTNFRKRLLKEASHKPLTIDINDKDLLSDPEVVLWLDLNEITHEDIKSFKVRHLMVANRSGKYQGICLFFTCIFPANKLEAVTLSTNPEEESTHWKQTVIVLPQETDVDKNEPIAFELGLSKVDNERKYTLEVTMLNAEEMDHPEYCNCHMTKCIIIRGMLDRYESGLAGDPGSV